MFRREAHERVLAVLASFDADVLETARSWFGGGCRIAMDHGEYRLSNDVDFLCSDTSGYADLRLLVRNGGAEALFRAGCSIELPREARIDQYGIRFVAKVADVPLRVEIVNEGRIALGLVDCCAEKLLANSDRGNDADTLARDAIDLAVLRHFHGAIPPAAWALAEGAYKTAPRRDLTDVVARLLDDDAFRERCFSGLSIEEPAPVLDGLASLAAETRDR